MGIFDKKYTIKIAQDDLNDAKLSSATFVDESTRKKAFIDVLGARLAMKWLFSKKIKATNLYSLYTIHNVLGQLDISDIYSDGIKMDVRLVFDKNEIFIPKSQFEYGILPDFYLVFSLNPDFSSTELLGFIEPKNIDKTLKNDDFYFVEKENLLKPGQLKTYLQKFKKEDDFKTTPENFEKAEALLLASIDNEIDYENKTFLFQQLAGSFELREKFVELENFELLSLKTASAGLTSDAVLDIIGSQRVFNETEAAEGSGLEYQLETIDLSVDSDIDDLFNEMTQEDSVMAQGEQKDSEENNNAAGMLAGGMALAGGVAVAGGMLAAGAATGAAVIAAQAATTAASTSAAAEGLATVAGSVVESIKNSPFEFDNKIEAATAESSLAFIEDDVTTLENQNEEFASFIEEFTEKDSGVLPEQQEFNLDELELLAKEEGSETEVLEELVSEGVPSVEILEHTEELFANDAAVVEELPIEELVEPQATEETQEEMKEFDLDEIAALVDQKEIETKTEFLEELVSEDVPSVETIEFNETEPLAEIFDDLPIAACNEITELTPLEDLPPLDEFVPILDSDIFIEEPTQSADTVDLNDFDFTMFDEDYKTESESSENTVSFDDLAEKELPMNEFVDELSDLDDKLEELDDENNSMDDIQDISSQVDNFLKDIELSDSQKNLLQNEIDIEVDDIEMLSDTMEAQPINPEENQGDQKATPSELKADLDLLTSSNQDNENKDPLKVLFENENLSEEEFGGEPLEIGEREKIPTNSFLKNKKVIIAASVAGLMLVTIAAGGIVLSNKNNAAAPPEVVQNTALPAEGQNQSILSDANPGMPMGENASGITNEAMMTAATPENQMQAESRDMGQAVSDAFSSTPITANVTKIAWEVPEDLAYNDAFRKYLQVAGKNLKLTLSNDLLLTTEMAYSNKMVLDLKIAKDGSVQASNVAVTSGSKQIDGIVLQSVKETLKYLKMPSDEVGGSFVNATLIINF